MRLTPGTKFYYDYKTWEVLKRHENYIMVIGRQFNQPHVYTACPIFGTGDQESAEPRPMNYEPGSAIYSRSRVEELYNDQVRAIDKNRELKKQLAEQQRQKDLKRMKLLERVNEAKKKKSDAEVRLKDLIYDDASEKRIKAVIEEIAVCDSIIKNLI